MKLQLQLEDTFNSIARSTGKPSVVVYDRGIMDIAAYVPAAIWSSVLRNCSLSGRDSTYLHHRYDMVLHLVTAANGAEQFYTKANNAVRSETPELAREIDSKIIGAWRAHPRLAVVDNSTDFNGKMARVVEHVTKLVDEPPGKPP